MSDPARTAASPFRVNRAPATPRAPAGEPLDPNDPRVPALVRYMAFSGVGTDACLAQGAALPMPVHFYSPVPDIPDLRRRKVWARRTSMPGVDFREQAQVETLRALGAAAGQECDWPLAPTGDPNQFHLNNQSFSYGCAAALHAMIRTRKPRRFIEVGSGNSSRVIAAALLRNEREGAPRADYTIIDPEPGPAVAVLPGLTQLIPERVEVTDPARFEALGPDDILFIDSSHMVKIGGDVNFLYLDVLPRLGPGVVVHIHDISLPGEYPEVYCTNPGFRVFWTEGYLLQAFLAFNSRFEVLLGMAYLMMDHMDAFRAAFPRWDPEKSPALSGSFWMRRKP
jgi:hypothetical protein